MSKKKSRKDKKGNLFLTAIWQNLKREREPRNKKNFKNYFIHLKIWKNNLDKSRENGGLGSYQLKDVYVFSQWAEKAKQKEEVYLFKELR